MQPTAPNSQELRCLISLISLFLAQRWAGYRSPSDGDASGPEPVNTPLETPSKGLQRAVPTAKDHCQGTGLRLLHGFRDLKWLKREVVATRVARGRLGWLVALKLKAGMWK